MNHSSCKHSALSCALVFSSLFSCPSSHIFKTGRHIGTEIYGKSMEFFGAKSQTSLPQKVQPYPPSVFSAGGGYGSDGSGGGGGGGGVERRLYPTATQLSKLVPVLPHSLTTTPAICSSAHLQTARHRSTEDKVR